MTRDHILVRVPEVGPQGAATPWEALDLDPTKSKQDVECFLYVSRCVLEPPVLPADLFVLSPGYEVPPDLATVPPPFSMCSLCLWCPQHRFECSK